MAIIIEICNLDSEELRKYSKLNEIQLARIYEPKLGLFIAESSKVIERAMDAGYEPESLLIETKELEGQAKRLLERIGDNVPVYTADVSVLKQITGYELTRGILAAMKRKEHPSIQEICKGARRIAVLESIQNPTNVGAIFRSAAALKVDAVLLTYDCSDPLYRRSARVSMGNVFLIPWTYIGKGEDWIQTLQDMGFATAAMALSDDSVSIDDENLLAEEKLAIILGNEGEGLLEETIGRSNYTVKIPMADGVDSLNVAAASAVAFWQLCK